MKLLMIIVDSSCKEELEVLFRRSHVTGYTELPNAHGVGSSGIRMGSRAFPKTSSVLFTVLPDDKVEALREDIKAYCEACERNMKMYVLAAEEVM